MKYTLTGVKKWYKVSSGEQAVVEQIKALVDIPNKKVKKGDLGGWVANKDSLSQDGTCWISENSVVCGGAKVEDHAGVSGNSSIETYSEVRDGAIVFNSTVTDFSVVDGSTKVTDSMIGQRSLVMNLVTVDDSALLGVSISKGSIKKSRVVSKNTRLNLSRDVHIDNSHLVITDAEPVVEENFDMKNVVALDVYRFCIHEYVKVQYVTFEGRTFLNVGEPENDEIFSLTVIKGKAEGDCIFQDAVVSITDSRIEGMVTLKGWIELVKCELTDMAAVLNEGKMLLQLKDVKVSEMAVIQHRDNIRAKAIENESIGMDTFLTV